MITIPYRIKVQHVKKEARKGEMGKIPKAKETLLSFPLLFFFPKLDRINTKNL